MNASGAREIDLEMRCDYSILAILTTLISVFALGFYYRTDAILLYGDAAAHINIARRVFDSRTPGFFQLGTVWLPLPHLLQIPLILSDRLWRTGVGGSIPSMAAYIAGTLGVFRLVRGLASRTAAWISAAIYGLNPNVIYMQTTAMNEPLYLALFVWTVVFFAEFVAQASGDADQAAKSLEKCGIILCAAELTRYDAWFLAAILSASVVIFIWKLGGLAAQPLRRAAINFVLLAFLTPCLWLAYNHVNYGNALEFANGPYSASAIQQRSRTASMPTYPGEHSLRTATLYFLKVSRMNLGHGWLEYPLLIVAFVALLSVLYFSRGAWPAIFLWSPLLFYSACMVWGSVPIYLPEWWPFSYYNVRYGLQMLPVVAVFAGIGCRLLSNLIPGKWIGAAAAVLIVISYWSAWASKPVCLREAEVNGRPRLQFDRHLAALLHQLPDNSTILMDGSAHPAAIQLAGIPFRRVLRESNPPYWEEALTQPGRSADYVVAIDEDDVARAVRLFPQGLHAVAIISTSHDYRAMLYQSTHQ